MTKILLIRHGHVEGIKPAQFRGRQPLELTLLKDVQRPLPSALPAAGNPAQSTQVRWLAA